MIVDTLRLSMVLPFHQNVIIKCQDASRNLCECISPLALRVRKGKPAGSALSHFILVHRM